MPRDRSREIVAESNGLWRRLAIEGPVIVISILLAFAIDAWWDGRQQERATLEQLRRVAAELESNAARIAEKNATLVAAIDATIEFLSWMGPEPDEVPFAAFSESWTRFLSIGFLTVQRAATADVLTSGKMDSPDLAELRLVLSSWSEQVDQLEHQYALLRIEHAKLTDHLQAVIASSHITTDHPLMADVPASRFPFNHQTLLADGRLEGLLALYLIRLKFVVTEIDDFMQTQSRVSALIATKVID